MTFLMQYIYFMVMLVFARSSKAEITVSYTTSFPGGSGYHVLDAEHLTLICSFTEQFGSLSWYSRRGNEMVIFTKDGPDKPEVIPETVYKSRIVSSSFTSNSHIMVITVDKEQDEGQTFQCRFLFLDGLFPVFGAVIVNDILGMD